MSNSHAIKQCSRVGWCRGMAEALYGMPENHEGAGLYVSRGWIGEEKTPRRLGVFYRSKRGRDPIVLNVCSWCGARIRFDEMDAPTFVIPPELPDPPEFEDPSKPETLKLYTIEPRHLEILRAIAIRSGNTGAVEVQAAIMSIVRYAEALDALNRRVVRTLGGEFTPEESKASEKGRKR